MSFMKSKPSMEVRFSTKMTCFLELAAERDVRQQLTDGLGALGRAVTVLILRNFFRDGQCVLAHRPEGGGKVFGSVIVHSVYSSARLLNSTVGSGAYRMTHPEEFTDTDPRAMEVWLDLQRRMPAGEKLAVAVD